MSKTQPSVTCTANECQSTQALLQSLKLLRFISLLNLQPQECLIPLSHVSIQTPKWVLRCSLRPAWLCTVIAPQSAPRGALQPLASGSWWKHWPILQIVSWRRQAAFLFATVWFCRTSRYRPAKDKHQDVNLLYPHQGRVKADDNSSVMRVGCQHTRATASTHRVSKNTCPYPRPSLLRDVKSQASCRTWCNTSSKG